MNCKFYDWYQENKDNNPEKRVIQELDTIAKIVISIIKGHENIDRTYLNWQIYSLFSASRIKFLLCPPNIDIIGKQHSFSQFSVEKFIISFFNSAIVIKETTLMDFEEIKQTSEYQYLKSHKETLYGMESSRAILDVDELIKAGFIKIYKKKPVYEDIKSQYDYDKVKVVKLSPLLLLRFPNFIELSYELYLELLFVENGQKSYDEDKIKNINDKLNNEIKNIYNYFITELINRVLPEYQNNLLDIVAEIIWDFLKIYVFEIGQREWKMFKFGYDNENGLSIYSNQSIKPGV